MGGPPPRSPAQPVAYRAGAQPRADITGSVSPRPDARKVQFRLYYEIDGQMFTDGILHQAELRRTR